MVAISITSLLLLREELFARTCPAAGKVNGFPTAMTMRFRNTAATWQR